MVNSISDYTLHPVHTQRGPRLLSKDANISLIFKSWILLFLAQIIQELFDFGFFHRTPDNVKPEKTVKYVTQ